MGQSKIWLSSPHMGTEELKNVQEAFIEAVKAFKNAGEVIAS